MRAVVQRVRSCSVSVDSQVIGSIDEGLLVYLGVEQGDGEDDIRYLSDKVTHLRIFPDDQGKMNLSVSDCRFGILVVSQFTLCADVRRGRRPSFTNAADPALATDLYMRFIDQLRPSGCPIAQGSFGALMDVTYTNHGPVTILLDSRRVF